MSFCDLKISELKKRHDRITRRKLFRGLGQSALLFQPMMDLAMAQSNEEKVKRFVAFFSPHGFLQQENMPQNFISSTQWDLGYVHEPLQNFRSKVNIFQGVDYFGGGWCEPHAQGVPNGLTALPPANNNSSGTNRCYQPPGAFDAMISSIDFKIGKAFKERYGLAYETINLGAFNRTYRGKNNISYGDNGVSRAALADPNEAFNFYFASLLTGGSGDTGQQMEFLHSRRKSIFDLVLADYNSLKNRVSTSQKNALEQSVEGLRSAEQNIVGFNQTVLQCSQFSGVPPEFNLNPPYDGGRNREYWREQMPLLFDLQSEIIRLAFECDLSRSATLMMQFPETNTRYEFLDGVNGVDFRSDENEGFHTESHNAWQTSGARNQRARARCNEIQRWHSTKIAEFCNRLSQTDQNGESLFDQTAMTWVTELNPGGFGVGDHGKMRGTFPLIGDANGSFKTGEFFLFQDQARIAGGAPPAGERLAVNGQGLYHGRLLAGIIKGFLGQQAADDFVNELSQSIALVQAESGNDNWDERFPPGILEDILT